MRNLKKLLAVIVSVCVLATFALPAFAAEQTAAEICEDLGVLKGEGSDGVSDAYLAKGTSRMQAALLYLRLIGKEDEALAFEGEDNFADADQTWAAARPVLAYLKANPELGWQGVGADKFDPKATASAQMMYKVCLEALGYKQDAEDGFKWADVFTFAADKGLSLIADVTDLTNNDVAIALVETLKLNLKDSTTTLAADLVAKGVVTEAAAEAAGLIGGAVALDVSGAVALNSKIVEVSLGTAATAKDVAAATFAVKDAAAKEIAVTGAEVAPWSADGKSVLVTLGADTAVGTLYTLTVGDKSFNFGGKPVDTAKPTATIASTDYNEVTITFSEAVKIETAKVTAAKAYGDKAALELSDVRYDGSSKLVYTSADQADATLYKAVIENVSDLAGNVMDKAEPTFVGTPKPTGDQEVVAAKALDYKSIYVEFKINVDSATVAAENFTLAEAYGDKAVIAIAEATMATATQAGKYNTANNTDDLKKAAAKKGVVLTLTGEVKDATLYKLTAKGISTLYGKALSSTEAKTIATFTGKSKPGADSLTYTATASSNTEVKLTFANDLDQATAENIANYAIAKAYGDKAALAVSKAVLSDGNVVTLTVASMAIDMYKVTATGIMDIYGNSIKTSSDANIQSFAGKGVAAKIDSFTVVDVVAPSKGKVEVDFNQNYGDGALDVASYSIDKGIGYPSKVEKVSGSTTKVTLTIPYTEIGTLYTITVKGVKNSDGVAMDAAGIKKTFVGNDEAAGAAKLEAAYAVDSKTLRLYFNKNVEDISDIDRSSATNLALEIAVTEGAGAVAISHAFIDPADKKVIIAYTTDDDFKDGGADDVFKVTLANAGLDGDNDSKTFAENTNDAAKIKVDGVVAVNNKTLNVYFNQPVRFLAAGTDNGAVTDAFGYVETGAAAGFVEGTDSEVTAVRSTNDTNTIWEVSLDTALTATEYKLVLNAYSNTLISNIASGTTLNVLDDTLTYSFAGNATEDLYVKDVYAVSVNKRTIKVYFPEAMLNADLIDETNYKVFKADGTTDAGSTKIVLAEADSANKIVTLTMDGDFTDAKFMQFGTVGAEIKNALQTKKVLAEAGKALQKELALSDGAATKLEIKEVSSTAQVITVKFNQRFKTAADVTVTALDATELVKYLEIKVNTSGTPVTLVAGDIVDVKAKLGDGANVNSSTSFVDTLVITVDATPDLELNGQGSVELLNAATATGINNEVQNTDQSAIVFVQK